MDPRLARSAAIAHAHRDFPLIRPSETVGQALEKLRAGGLSHKIIYLYVADAQDRLLGVLPTRLLLTADPSTQVDRIFVRKAVFLPATATMAEARDAFARHQFLAFPIVDEACRVQGVIDIQPFAGRLDDLDERTHFDDVYELLGLQASMREEASSLLSFRMRFPWLISTLVAGSLGAVLTSLFEATLREQIALAFFFTLVLGLNESVCMQSATLAIQRLHAGPPAALALLRSAMREARVALLLGLACSTLVAALVVAWRRDPRAAASIGASLLATITASCLWGMLVPPLLRRMQRDPKVAAAPIALALSDITTLAIYFGVASWMLSKG